MKVTLKILKYFAILSMAVTIILFSAAFLLQGKVADIILNSLNKNISTKLHVGSFRLSFLRKFPKASLELKDVLVHSSTDFNSGLFTGINTDTLLIARFVSVDFKITDILKGTYNIDRIGARDGKLNIFTDTAGHVNYDVSVKRGTSANEILTINLERINLSGINTYYNNLGTKLIITGLIKNGKLKGRISGENIDFTVRTEMDITSFKLFNTIITKTIAADLDIILQKSNGGIRYKKGSLAVENYKFYLDGFISRDNILDLNVTGKNIDLARIRKYLPDKYLGLVSDYNPSGLLNADCIIKGPLTRTKNPHVEINCILNNGYIAYGKSDLTIKNLSFTGHLSNGSKNNFETSSASINEVKFKLGSSAYTGSMKISGFNHPKSEIILKGRVFPQELKGFFDIQKISSASGSVDVDLKIVTNFWPKGTVTKNNIIDLKPEGNLNFNSFSIGLNDNKFLINKVNGNLSLSDITKADKLTFIYASQEIKVDGEFRNLPEWLAGRPVQMTASADISFNRLIPEVFLESSSSSKTKSVHRKSVTLPEDIVLDINFKIDSLKYKSFSSSKIAGTLNYKSRRLTIKSLNMHSLNGIISGNGFVVQNNNKSVIAKGTLIVTKIDVNKAFKAFHNFGQDFLKAENIAGSLSGSLSLLFPMDSTLKPQINSITAEGKYLLNNGALINFDPVKRLSSFIELSELENINFDKLENDFFIRNSVLYVPQMDVKSSAADLSINGKHNFDNNYEYHVKILLSEILSRQRKKNRHSVTEFGAIEDDGLGRTSLLLKIVYKGKDVKVGYDILAAGNEIKNNIKSEKKSLKTILNQEYGWFSSDTTVKQVKTEKKSRFKISWGDTDSGKTTSDPPAEKKRTR